MSLNVLPGVIKEDRPLTNLPGMGMNSLKLLRQLMIFWHAVENPLFVRETNHAPVWYRVYKRLAQATGVSLVVGGLVCYLSIVLVFLLNNILILFIPVLMFWMVLTSLTLAPIVVGERERQTWETLRTTPLDTETILIGKAGGALWWQRDVLRAMIALLLVFAAGIGLLSLILVPTSEQYAHFSDLLLCGSALVIPMIVAAAFVADRAQQFALMVAGVLATSASAHSNRVALASAIVVSFLLWLVDIGVAGLLLAVQPGRTSLTVETNWTVLATLGPVADYLVEQLPLERMALYVAATLLIREAMVRLLWGWTIRRAQGD
jgi:hypothetical protein